MRQPQEIDNVRARFLDENARFFRVALRDINKEWIEVAKTAASSFTMGYLLDTEFDRIARRHFSRDYDRMWQRTPVWFATDVFKTLTNKKALTDIMTPINLYRGGLARRIQMVTNTTRMKYGSLLAEGRQLTNDVNIIAQFMDTSVKGAYIKLRAMQISRTETVFASNVGRRAGAQATNLPIVKTWVTMQDQNVRNQHQIANGQQRLLGQPFIVNGEQLMFPTDYTMGASAENIIGCRCLELYTLNT